MDSLIDYLAIYLSKQRRKKNPDGVAKHHTLFNN